MKKSIKLFLCLTLIFVCAFMSPVGVNGASDSSSEAVLYEAGRSEFKEEFGCYDSLALDLHWLRDDVLYHLIPDGESRLCPYAGRRIHGLYSAAGLRGHGRVFIPVSDLYQQLSGETEKAGIRAVSGSGDGKETSGADYGS